MNPQDEKGNTMNYMVFKNNRPAGTRKFSSYEAARQYARKLCRKLDFFKTYTDFSSNPSIGDFGYAVRSVSNISVQR